ncbi:MAG: hypothetical protein IPI07_19510 [Flavobacteriales bacterium]|nr:hypothetical protein [Flavobacteriales bacterium]
MNYYDGFDSLPTSLAPGGSNFPTATITFSDAAQKFYGFFAFAGADLNYLGFFDNNNTADYHFTNPWTYAGIPAPWDRNGRIPMRSRTVLYKPSVTSRMATAP